MTDLSLIDDEAWQLAKHRADVIRPLAAMPRCSHALASAAATELQLSMRQVYTLIKRYRSGEGGTASLVPGVSPGGRGRSRISQEREALVQDVINEIYLTPQRLTPEAVVREVRRRCQSAGLKAPAGNTIRRRISCLSGHDRRKRNENTVRPAVVAGRTPASKHPLAAVQIDHTQVDIILVDPVERKPIGRPWLTVAIDVFSRCIAGMHLSLEAPSATSVGLCLVHVATDKSQWLAERGVAAQWPIQGKPESLVVDNGAEFHSAAFERGCEQHGIAIRWRPPGQPHFGGIVERVIGSLMKLVHELPGTTFSNPGGRAGYDSDRMACLTLEELEHWLAVAITGLYHRRPHAGLEGEAPLNRYFAGMQKLVSTNQLAPTVKNPRAFLIDFLPVFRRTLQRDGITIDRITYYSSALKPWIAQRRDVQQVLVRRDPRDLSRIYVWEPKTNSYLEIPYRDLSRPAITVWEHRMALRRLKERHRTGIDEVSLFQAVAELREIERNAAISTKTTRRNQVRRQGKPTSPSVRSSPAEAAVTVGLYQPLPPFSEIEEW